MNVFAKAALGMLATGVAWTILMTTAIEYLGYDSGNIGRWGYAVVADHVPEKHELIPATYKFLTNFNNNIAEASEVSVRSNGN